MGSRGRGGSRGSGGKKGIPIKSTKDTKNTGGRKSPRGGNQQQKIVDSFSIKKNVSSKDEKVSSPIPSSSRGLQNKVQSPPNNLPQKSEKEMERDLEILLQFDLDTTYGPCIGISRMERFERASKFNLTPKVNPKIKEILTYPQYSQKKEFQFAKWEQNKLLGLGF